MEGQEHLAEVIPIRGRKEVINGVSVNLARLALPELETMADEAYGRMQDGQHDYSVIREEIDSRDAEVAE